MNKTLKMMLTLVMAIVMISTSVPMVFATSDSPSSIVDQIKPDMDNASGAAKDLTGIAGQVIGLIQIASAVAAVILIAVFGFKFILGSANEKADYQKSFIPLIVGVIVVFSATSIAKLLFGLIG